MKRIKYLSWLIIPLLIQLIAGCKSDFSSFQYQVLGFAADKKINESEFDIIVNTIKNSKDQNFKIFYNEHNLVDTSKLTSYLVKLCQTKSIDLAMADIWRPASSKANKFNINVYLENSGSMDGYVGENSNFKTTIFNLLTDFNRFPTTDSLNLSYINSRPISVYSSASRDEIKDFYERLNPKNFKINGRPPSSDLSNMVKQILDLTNERNLNLFISDCVFSPGNKDAKKYLDGQQAAFKNDFASALEDKDISLIIIQCSAKFEGTYYDYLNNPISGVNCDRPYYIWFIGTSNQIRSIVNNGIFDLIKGGYKNKLVFLSNKDNLEPNYRILMRPQIGSFKLETTAKGPITDAEVSRENPTRGKFGFTVAVDFSKSMQDYSYFSDTANYLLSGNYTLQISPVKDKSDPSFRDYTHLLNFQTANLSQETLKIDVVGKVPQWVYSSTSPNDRTISFDKTQQSQTFGLQYSIEGIADAFYPKNKTNSISSFSIIIKR